MIDLNEARAALESLADEAPCREGYSYEQLQRDKATVIAALAEIESLRKQLAECTTDTERVSSHELLRRGGEWLGAARSWIQRKCVNGEIVTWGSNHVLNRNFTVADVEEIASIAAAAAMRPQPNEARLSDALKARWKAEVEAELLRSQLSEARANFLRCAEAVGCVYEAEGRAAQPRPIEEVESDIRDAVRKAGNWIEMVERVAIPHADLGTLVVCSVRYALGRITVAVTEVARITREQWPHLTENDRHAVTTSVRRAVDRGEAGMACDVEVWADLLRWIEGAVATEPTPEPLTINGIEVRNLRRVRADGYSDGHSFTFEAKRGDAWREYGPFVTGSASFAKGGDYIEIGYWPLQQAWRKAHAHESIADADEPARGDEVTR